MLFVISFMAMSSILFVFGSSQVTKDKINLIAKVEIKDTKYLTIITTSDSNQVLMLYRLHTNALNETAPHIVVNVKPTPLGKALELDSNVPIALGKLAVLASFDNFKILIGAEFGTKEVTELEISKAKMTQFSCSGDDHCPIMDTAWLSSLSNDDNRIIVIKNEHFAVMEVEEEDIKIGNKVLLCTKNDKYYFEWESKKCEGAEPYIIGTDIQGFFTSNKFYILDRSNHQVLSFPKNVFKKTGTMFTIQTTKFDDFFVASGGDVSTSKTFSTKQHSEKSESSTDLEATTKKMSTSTIIIIAVSALIAVTLLIVLIITIVCCCCKKKSKKKKKKKSSSKSSPSSPRKGSKKKRSSAKKSSEKRKKKNSRSRSKESKRSKRKDSKRRSSKRKDSKGRKLTKSSSKPKHSRAQSKSRKRTSASKAPSRRSTSQNPGSSPFSSRYFSSG